MANTIQDKLAYLEETKGLIKEAIVAKGVSVSDTDTFRSYADKIEAIETGGGETAKIDAKNFKFGFSDFAEFDPTPFDFANKTDCNNMFNHCIYLKTVNYFDSVKVRDMTGMFRDCSNLQTVPQLNTINVTNMSYMFYFCSNLQTVPQLNTINVTNMSSMFYFCSKIETIPQLDTNKVTNMYDMFNNCASLVSVQLMDLSICTYVNSMFNKCSSLTTLGGFTGLKLNLDLSSSSKLTVESVMNVIANAADMTSSPRTLTLHKDVFNKLTEEQIATATAKGWNIASR